MADSEQTIALETVLQRINDSGGLLKTSSDGSILTTTEDGEAVIVYCMEQPTSPKDSVILLNEESIESQVQVVQHGEEMDDDNVTKIVVTGQDGLERIVHLQTNTIELEQNTMDQIVENDIQLNTVEMDNGEGEVLGQSENGDGGQNPLHKFINEGSLDQLSEIVIYRESESTPTADDNFLIQPTMSSSNRRHHFEHECDVCSKVFPNVRALRQHRKTPGPCKRMWENGEKPLVCEVCGKSYSRLLRYKAHVALHNDPQHGQKIKCTECEKTFRAKWEMVQHRVKRHGLEADEFSGMDDRKCQFCGRQFKFRKSFLKHQSNGCNKVRIQIYECRHCDKRYMSDKYLQKHLEKGCTALGSSEKKNCSQCNWVFKDQESLERHIESVHSQDNDEAEIEEIEGEEMTHPCSNCGQEFGTKEDFDRHQADCRSNVRTVSVPKARIDVTLVGGATLECLNCALTFPTKTKLDTHMIRQHGMPTPFRCTECDKYFANNDDLKVHRRIHTGDKPYSCQFCEQKFRTTSHLAKHIRAHTGERPYPCHFCPKRFISLGSRTQHLRMHTKERPFPCDLCDKTFVTSSLRLAHRRSHTGQMNYACPLCQSAYIYRYQLKSHEEAHEKGSIEEGKTFCSVCDQWLPLETRNDHFLRLHSVHTWFVCESCSRRFVSEENCLNHCETHESVQDKKPAVLRVELEEPDPTPVCQNCDVTFFVRSALAEHESNCKGRTEQSDQNASKPGDNAEYVVLTDDDQEKAMTSIREAFKDGNQELGKDLTCPRCRYKFKFHNAFNFHIQANSCHSQLKSGCILCQRCHKVFTNFKQFYAHREDESCQDVNKEDKEEEQSREAPEDEAMGNPCELYGLGTGDMTCNGCNRKFMTTVCYVRHLKEEHDCDENCDVVDKVSKETENTRAIAAKSSPSKLQRAGIGKSHFRHWQNVHCETCSKTFSTAFAFFEHYSSSPNCKCETPLDSIHPCHACAKVFNIRAHLTQHLKSHSIAKHPGSKCDVCDQGLEKQNLEMAHVLVEHGKMPFRCRICNKTAVSLKVLEKHVKEQHQMSEVGVKKTRTGSGSRRGTRFQCGQCGETFLSAGGLMLHNQKHRENAKPSKKVKLSCKFCGLQCNGQERLDVHLNGCKMKRKSGEKFHCSECVVEFQSKQYRDQHVETYHNATVSQQGVNVACPLCERLFASEDLMKLHLRFHGVVSALDLEDLLNQETTSLPSFDAIVEAEEIVEEETSTEQHQKQPLETCEVREVIILPIENTEPQLEYRCSDCGTGFQRRPSIVAHIRRAHRGKINLIREVNVFHCGACAARLDDRQALLRHYSEVHSCTLPSEQSVTFQYQTDDDNIVETSNVVVKAVPNKGSGHTWYSCPSCEEMFESEQTLLRHEFYSHNHSCSECSSTFATSSELETHICVAAGVATIDSSEVPVVVVEEPPRRPLSKRSRKRKVYDDFEMEMGRQNETIDGDGM